MVGAGFGLYLNRRVQLEAWDVEHAFRRIAARLSRGAQTLCLLPILALGGLASHPAAAMQAHPCVAAVVQAAKPASTDQGSQVLACPVTDDDQPIHTTLPTLFGDTYRHDGAAFATHLKQARAGLTRSERDWMWAWRGALQTHTDNRAPDWVQAISDFIALLARYWLWIVAGLLLAFVLYHHKVWMSWMRDAQPAETPSPIDVRELDAHPALPVDIPATVRALWQRGEQRTALALLYQAAVQRLAERLGTPLPPGATEGECLARSRRLGDRRYAGLFTRIVQCWQAAAYARRMPETDLVEGLLADWIAPGTVAA